VISGSVDEMIGGSVDEMIGASVFIFFTARSLRGHKFLCFYRA
jgi:hypothetical protein